MKIHKLLSISTAALLASLLPGQASISVNLGPWYTGSNSGTPSFDPANTRSSFTWGSGSGSGSESARDGLLWTYFDDVTLANNMDSVRISFTVEWSSTASESDLSFRFGLFNHGGSTLTSNLSETISDPAFANSLGYFAAANLGFGESGLRARGIGNGNPLSNTDSESLISDLTFTEALEPGSYNVYLKITRYDNQGPTYDLEFAVASGGIFETTFTLTADTFNTFLLHNTADTDLDSISFSNFEIKHTSHAVAAENISAPFPLDLRLNFTEWAVREGVPAEGVALLDYALGRQMPADGGSIRTMLAHDQGVADTFVFSYSRSSDAVGVSLIKEVSTDLVTWLPAIPIRDELVEHREDGLELWEARFEADSELASRFFRIRTVTD